MLSHYDQIVVGLGSMGSSALYHLSKYGNSVLGLEQYLSPHENGSHAGQSRIIRMAYYEHPNYIPLLQKAYQNWEEIESVSGKKIFYHTGLYYAGPVDNEIIVNVKKSADQYNIQLANERLQQLTVPGHWESFTEPNAGFLRPELAIRTYLDQAQINGATILQNTKVQDWKRVGKLIKVNTSKGTFTCNKIIFTAGPWTASLIKEAKSHLKITRQVLAWIKVPETTQYTFEKFPCWFIADEEKPGAYYGFPWLDKETFGVSDGLKLAYHYPGEITEPNDVNRIINENDLTGIKEFVRKYFKIEPEIIDVKNCLYSNTPDEHFVIDNIPGFEESACFAWGFSGHGFKFVSVVGEILAELAMNKTCSLPIDFLNSKRF